MNKKKLVLDSSLVHRLVKEPFPKWTPITGTDCDKVLNEIIAGFNLVSGGESHGN